MVRECQDGRGDKNDQLPPPGMLSSGRPARYKTVTIECIECGGKRVIHIQDAFQVVRCIKCQRKYRNKRNRLAREGKLDHDV